MKKLIITFFALMATVAGVALGADAKKLAPTFSIPSVRDATEKQALYPTT